MKTTIKLAVLSGLAAAVMAGTAALTRAPRADACTVITCTVTTQPALPSLASLPVVTRLPPMLVVRPDLVPELFGTGGANPGDTYTATVVLYNQGKAKATNASVKIVAGAGTLAGVQSFDGG